MVLVDSSIWIQAARRNGDLACKVGLKGLLAEFEATLCPPVRMEVLGGATATERARLESDLAVIPYCPITEQTWQEAIHHAWKLRDNGFILPWTDILVGTLALALGCRVYAKDTHFETMRAVLGVRLYDPDYGGKFRPE